MTDQMLCPATHLVGRGAKHFHGETRGHIWNARMERGQDIVANYEPENGPSE